ncbi:MAG: dienelactone hydrolase family protein [Anaerolineales bacterium]
MGKLTSFSYNGHKVPGFLAIPEGPGPFPAVVAIQEWWGLVGHIKDVCDRFAAEGFVALAPDLYHGESADEPNEARKLSMALDRDRAIGEIGAAARYLRSIPEVGGKKVGIVGWCMGGGLALSAAAHSDRLDAVVCFYGRPLETHDTAKLKAPVLGLYGELDSGIPASMVQDFDKELEKLGVPHYIHTYAGAQHAFFNDDRPAYHPEAAKDAWGRTLAWFRQHLT